MSNLRVDRSVKCVDFPCQDVDKSSYTIPSIEIASNGVKTFMISEAPPPELKDYFYAGGSPFFMQTTLQAFRDAGFDVSSIDDILDLGVYITTAIKCGKTGYSISSKTIDNCSRILEDEINLFSNVKSILLMGDTSIKALNNISKRNTGVRIIPSGSTYKIRKGEYIYKQYRVYPSYLQTGKSYLIEKSKRKMIAEDLKAAIKVH